MVTENENWQTIGRGKKPKPTSDGDTNDLGLMKYCVETKQDKEEKILTWILDNIKK